MNKTSAADRGRPFRMLSVCVGLLAALPASAVIDARTYLQGDDVVAQWDGIANGGFDENGNEVHLAKPSAWVDVSGHGRNLGNIAANVWWSDKAFEFPTNGATANLTSGASIGESNFQSYEILYAEDDGAQSSTWGFFFGFGSKRLATEWVNVNGGKKEYLNTDNNSMEWSIEHSFGTLRHVYVDYGSLASVTATRLCLDGAEMAAGKSKVSWNGASGIGYKNNYPMKARIYALRLYTRALTAAELATHRRIDNIRFLGGDASDFLEITGAPSEIFSPVPAYGKSFGCPTGTVVACSLSPYAVTNDTTLTYCCGYRTLADNVEQSSYTFAADEARAFSYVQPANTNGCMIQWIFRDKRPLVVTSAGTAGGKVTLDGAEIEFGKTYWFDEGTEVTLAAVDTDVAKFMVWMGDSAVAGKTTRAVRVVVNGPLTAVCQFQDAVHVPVTLGWAGGETGRWEDPSCWMPAAVPQEGDTVLVTNGVATTLLVSSPTPRLAAFVVSNSAANAETTLVMSNWTTRVAADTVVLGANARVTCAGPFTVNEMSNRVWLAGTTLTVAKSAKITVDNVGYAAGKGPGAASGAAATYGAPYAGWAVVAPPAAYGSAEWPMDPGSGSAQYPGGGAIRLDFTGSVVVDGALSACATLGRQNNCTASGGAILLQCRTLEGEGSFTACSAVEGRFDTHFWCGGPGRIAVHYDPVAQSNVTCEVSFSALGGIGADLSYTEGSVVWDDADNGDLEEGVSVFQPGSLWFSDNQFLFSATYAAKKFPFHGSWQSAEPMETLHWSGDWTLKNAQLRFPFVRCVEIDGSLGLEGKSTYGRFIYGLSFVDADVTVRGSVSLQTARLQLEGGKLFVTGNVETVLSNGKFMGGELALYAQPTNTPGSLGGEAKIGGTLHLAKGGVLAPFAAKENGAVVRVTAKDVTVDAGAVINADTKGYGATLGPGGTLSSKPALYGAAYGGQGGIAVKGTAAERRLPYGRWRRPVEPGSGGGRSGTFNARGGGLVWLDVKRNFVLNGLVSADGNRCNISYYWRSAASSGGGVYIRVRRLSGTGSIRARGGLTPYDEAKPYDPFFANGGGGRVAILAGNFDELADFAANNVDVSKGFSIGSEETGGAEDGTVYLGELPVGLSVDIR